MPVAASHLWFWFRELDSQRTSNGYGPNPIGFQEIKAWADLRGHKLKQWHIDALVAMDLKRRVVSAKAADAKDKKEEQASVSERPLSPQLFDALFPANRR
ncbi:hypothetical protein LAV84_18245 [Rhizobium sp. VS19-DR104.2]|uniref:phage tail assembly chaperone n=1 Tax=unclassified Rhizobium TaxID=2613769 RepID=UPI001CC62A15|nr:MULTISPECIES: hypothetical protein [unclassified Rhizobium]MBZ5761591.1 hypothetical protein [Rhizobium sp. VS19-DR96]MBZ5767539.1 hypothetical protein [Rhizobium sp. VS19-DR129.2]MBZ5775011.1 hypothetical protein [Rhizobium sp. VS19-DRK62.2]MBZ5786022.1 hypothetical protein [Rhizobium sp. VS19-DR121]MBZ5803450.1 hypothetical protein [Rhizobium sp. VS19-DR181]